MRLVDIHLDGDHPVDVDLGHPCTVVVGDGDGLARLADVLEQAFVLAGTELGGTVDAGEFLTPLDPTTVVALDLPGDGLAVVGAGELPPVDRAGAEQRRVAAEAGRSAASAALEQAEAGLAAVSRRCELARTAVEVGRGELAGASARRRELEAALEDARRRPDVLAEELVSVRTELEVLGARRDALVAWEAEVAREWGPDGALRRRRSGADGAPGVARLVALVLTGVELGALDPSHREAVEAWATDVAAGTAAPDPRAQELAAAVGEVDAAWVAASSRGVEGDPEVAAAVAALEERVAALSDLEALAADGLLGEHARREVEDAHRGVVEAGGHRHGEREEAQRREDEALSRYGFDSYLDFTIALSTRSAREVAEEHLVVLREAAEAAERDLDAARRGAAARREELAARREEHLVDVATFLGERPEGSVTEALLAVPAVPPDVEAVGDEAAVAADEAVAAVTRAAAEVQDLESEQATCGPRREALEAQVAAATGREAQVRALVERAEVTAAAAEERLASVVAERDSAAAALAEAEDRRRVAELAADGLGPEELVALADDLGALVGERSGPGLPVVLHDTLSSLGADAAAVVLGRLVRRTAHGGPQVVYLTRDRSLAEWARGATDVGVVELRRPGWLRRQLGRRARHHA